MVSVSVNVMSITISFWWDVRYICINAWMYNICVYYVLCMDFVNLLPFPLATWRGWPFLLVIIYKLRLMSAFFLNKLKFINQYILIDWLLNMYEWIPTVHLGVLFFPSTSLFTGEFVYPLRFYSLQQEERNFWNFWIIAD